MEDIDDIFDNSSEKNDEKFILSQNLKRLLEPVEQEGFREGVSAGRDEIFQKGFDEGYLTGFEAGLSIGYYNSIVKTLQDKEFEKLPSNLDTTKLIPFENPMRGFCHLCTDSGKLLNKTEIESNLQINVNVPLDDVINKQKLIIENMTKEKQLFPDYKLVIEKLNLDSVS